SFTRAFGEHYGTSPSTFRQGAREPLSSCGRLPQLELAARSGLHYEPGPRSELVFSISKGGIAMQVELKDRPEARLAAIRHVGPYARIAEAFQRLGAVAEREGFARRPGSEMIAIYHDDPETTPVDELRSDAAVTVAADSKLPGDVTEVRLPAGR